MYAMSERYDRLVEQTLQDIKSTLHDHSQVLSEIKEQTTKHNGRMTRLEEWRKSVDKTLKSLSVKKGGSINNLSEKTIYVLAIAVIAVVSLLAAALGSPIEWLKP